MPNTQNNVISLPRFMSISEACEHIGNNALLNLVINLSSLSIPVRILDARTRWGRIDFQISPENGSGAVWVESNKIKVLS